MQRVHARILAVRAIDDDIHSSVQGAHNCNVCIHVIFATIMSRYFIVMNVYSPYRCTVLVSATELSRFLLHFFFCF